MQELSAKCVLYKPLVLGINQSTENVPKYKKQTQSALNEENDHRIIYTKAKQFFKYLHKLSSIWSAYYIYPLII